MNRIERLKEVYRILKWAIYFSEHWIPEEKKGVEQQRFVKDLVVHYFNFLDTKTKCENLHAVIDANIDLEIETIKKLQKDIDKEKEGVNG